MPALPADGLRYVLIVVFARAIVDNKSAANLKPQRLYPPARPPTHIDMRLIVMSGVGRASAPSPYPYPYPSPYPSLSSSPSPSSVSHQRRYAGTEERRSGPDDNLRPFLRTIIRTVARTVTSEVLIFQTQECCFCCLRGRLRERGRGGDGQGGGGEGGERLLGTNGAAV